MQALFMTLQPLCPEEGVQFYGCFAGRAGSLVQVSAAQQTPVNSHPHQHWVADLLLPWLSAPHFEFSPAPECLRIRSSRS